MRSAGVLTVLAALTGLPFAAAAQDGAPDLAALIECRADVRDWGRLAFSLMEAPAVAEALGWKQRASDNPLLQEYGLPRAIRVFGRSATRIALTATGPMAVLEGVDPAALASELGIGPTVSSSEKFLGEKVIAETREEEGGSVFRTRIALNVSSVAPHPNVTLAGCSYVLQTSSAQ